MISRAARIALVAGVAIYYTLVVFNNLTDYSTNYQFVRHVLMMDSTAAGNQGMWRALNSSGWHTAFYAGIIIWESVVTVLCWWGAWRLSGAIAKPADVFTRAKSMAVAGLTLGMLLWLIAFLGVGGEWFLMWQSKTWNGQESAFRMFTVSGIVLLLLIQADPQDSP